MFRQRQHVERLARSTILAGHLTHSAFRHSFVRFPGPRLVIVASFLLAHFFPCLTSAQGKPAARPQSTATGKINITVPAGALMDHYWLYVDETLVSSPSYGASHKWKLLRTPDGEEVYGPGGLTAFVDENGKIQILNAALAQSNHFHRTLEVPVVPGTHTVEILTEDSGPNWDSGFPFLITGKVIETRRGQIAEYAFDLPERWHPVSAYAAPAMVACLDPSPDPPDTGRLEKAVAWYKGVPTVKALRTAAPSYVSGAKRLVRLDLPPELGGSREFDDAQVQRIVNGLQEMVDDKLPQRDPKSDCDRAFPEFLAKYAQLREVINRELSSFRGLARDVDSTR